MAAVMKVELDGYVFEKYPSSGTVNIYFDGQEVDVFTNYDIGSDFDAFEQSCKEYLEYMYESYQ